MSPGRPAGCARLGAARRSAPGPIFAELLSLGGLANLIRQTLTNPALLVGYGPGGITTVIRLVILSRLELSYAQPSLTAIHFVLLLFESTLVL